MKFIYIYIYIRPYFHMLVPRKRYMSRHFGSESISAIHSRNINFSPELSTNLLFLNLCLCFSALQTAEKSSPERPGCGAEPHLLSRCQPLRAAAPAAWVGPLIFRATALIGWAAGGSAGYYYFSKSDNPYSPLGIFAVLLYSSIASTKFCGFEK